MQQLDILKNIIKNNIDNTTMLPSYNRKLVIIASAVLCLILNMILNFGQSSIAEVPKNSQRLQESIGLVIGYRHNIIRMGTGFCVYSDATRSIYVTNRHVIHDSLGIIVVRQVPKHERLSARLIAIGSKNRDIALLEVQEGNVPVVVASTRKTYIGEPIATIGYPNSISSFSNHSEEYVPPTYSSGNIDSYKNDGFYIGAAMDIIHGNSGGPLFDTRTQQVIGIVTASSTTRPHHGEAISIAQLLLLAEQNGYSTIANTSVLTTTNSEQRQNGECPEDVRDLKEAYDRWNYQYSAYIRIVKSLSRNLASLQSQQQTQDVINQEQVIANRQVQLASELITKNEEELITILKHIEQHDSQEVAIVAYHLVEAVQGTDSYNERWQLDMQTYVYRESSGPPHTEYIEEANRAASESVNLSTKLQAYEQCVHIAGS